MVGVTEATARMSPSSPVESLIAWRWRAGGLISPSSPGTIRILPDPWWWWRWNRLSGSWIAAAWPAARAGLLPACGTACSRTGLARIWSASCTGRRMPERPSHLRELYWAENAGKAEPSGSQDMIGLLYPGVSRLDYDAGVEGGRFPAHVESNCEPEIARWVEEVFHLVPINQRPAGYSPLGIRNLDSEWIAQLGQTGKDCFDAIMNTDIRCLGAALNHCMRCWEAILPHTVQHPAISLDLKGILAWFQSRYAGAMYSGCGGGYMIVVSEEPVPGSLTVRVRIG